jgi:hypothetical protein
MEPKRIIFLSSSLVNLAQIFAKEHPEYLVFLIHDRAFPFTYDELENFHSFAFSKQRLYERNPQQYFDELGIYVTDFSPSLVITNNYTKLLPMSFIEFLHFRLPEVTLINIHHGDLSVTDKNGKMAFSGMYGSIRQLLDEARLVSTIHKIEDQGMDTGTHLKLSHPTTLKELKQKQFIHQREDLINLRTKNQVISFHERTKVLRPLQQVVKEILGEEENQSNSR